MSTPDPTPIAWCNYAELQDALAKRQSFNGWTQRYDNTDVALFLTPPSAHPPAPASDGERESVATALEEEAQWFEHGQKTAVVMRRAAALLRQPAPVAVPVAVAERPWERKGWRDTDGRCWWFNRAGIPEWQLTDGGPYGDFSLPANALPVPDHQPPQGGEVQP